MELDDSTRFLCVYGVIGVRWQEINSSAQNISLSLNTSTETQSYVEYYDVADGSSIEDFEYLSFVNTSPYSNSEVPFSSYN